MKRKFWLITTTLVLIIGLASACTGMIPVTDAQNTATQDAYVVQSALSTATMIALQNQISALQTQVAQGTPAAAPTLAAPTATLLPPLPNSRRQRWLCCRLLPPPRSRFHATRRSSSRMCLCPTARRCTLAQPLPKSGA